MFLLLLSIGKYTILLINKSSLKIPFFKILSRVILYSQNRYFTLSVVAVEYRYYTSTEV